jgi:hypothetical protein
MLIDLGADSYPSFADPDFAAVFLAGDVARASGWALRNSDTQARGLISATRMLQRLVWAVDPAPDPAAGADAINLTLQEVTAMLAADLLAKPRLFSDASANSNLKSVKAGSATVDFFSPVAGGPPLPVALWTMLQNAGLVGSGTADQIPSATVSGIRGECERPLGGRFPGFGWDWPIAERDYD